MPFYPFAQVLHLIFYDKWLGNKRGILGHLRHPLKTVALAVTPPQKAKKNVLIIQDIIFQMVRAALQLSDHFLW